MKKKTIPEVWIFGCSYTWGWLLDDSETFSYILQERLRETRVRNFSVNGYGTIHALLQLRNIVNGKNTEGATAVFVYNSFHLLRNAVTPEWLSAFQWFDPDKDWRLAKGYLHEGNVKVRLVPLQGDEYKEALKEKPATLDEQEQLTKGIFREILDICRMHNIKPVLAVQSIGDRNSDIVTYCRLLGFEVIDIAISMDNIHTFAPYDPHPNAQAHRHYAAKIYEYLRSALYKEKNAA
ncbi:MAG: hypothetical protein HY808_14690 [Nitrospirae bacterium]|nr:hypothetical protein [Nitrospirota bacterium]